MAKFVTPLLILALVGYVAIQPERPTKTWQFFVDACLSGPQGTVARCDCLADHLHASLSAQELTALLAAQSAQPALDGRIAAVVEAGAKRCF